MLNIKLLKICQALIKAISYDECPNMKRDRCPTASKKRLLSVTTLVNSIFEICLFFYQIGSSIYLKKQVTYALKIVSKKLQLLIVLKRFGALKSLRKN